MRPDIVEQRYVSGLKLLDHYFAYPDILKLFDNSSVMTQVGEFQKGAIVMLAERQPEWSKQYLGRHLQQDAHSSTSVKDLNDIDAVRKSYQALKNHRAKK